jgi:hypothetical protein
VEGGLVWPSHPKDAGDKMIGLVFEQMILSPFYKKKTQEKIVSISIHFVLYSSTLLLKIRKTKKKPQIWKNPPMYPDSNCILRTLTKIMSYLRTI